MTGPIGSRKPSRPRRVWNRIPRDVRKQIVELALDEPELSPREVATRFPEGGSQGMRCTGRCGPSQAVDRLGRGNLPICKSATLNLRFPPQAIMAGLKRGTKRQDARNTNENANKPRLGAEGAAAGF